MVPAFCYRSAIGAPMAVDLTDPIFNSQDAASAYFEAIRWAE